MPPRFTPGDAVTVPANLPAIHWVPGRSFGSSVGDAQSLELTTTGDPTTPLAFTATAQPDGSYLVVPTQALVAGTSYTITDSSECGGTTTPTAVTFTAGPAVPLPTQLGALTAQSFDVSTLSALTVSGSCTSTVWADQATFDFAVATDAQPWIHALLIETVADGVVWSGKRGIYNASYTGVNHDRIYHVCATDDPGGVARGLASGAHAVVLRATLPGTATTLESTEATTTLECDTAPPPAVCTDYPGLCEDDAVVDPDLPDDKGAGCCSSSKHSPDAAWLLVALAALANRLRGTRRGTRRS